MTLADCRRAERQDAEAHIKAIDDELKLIPYSHALIEERRAWARAAYIADAELQRLEAEYDRT